MSSTEFRKIYDQIASTSQQEEEAIKKLYRDKGVECMTSWDDVKFTPILKKIEDITIEDLRANRKDIVLGEYALISHLRANAEAIDTAKLYLSPNAAQRIAERNKLKSGVLRALKKDNKIKIEVEEGKVVNIYLGKDINYSFYLHLQKMNLEAILGVEGGESSVLYFSNGSRYNKLKERIIEVLTAVSKVDNVRAGEKRNSLNKKAIDIVKPLWQLAKIEGIPPEKVLEILGLEIPPEKVKNYLEK